jgi:hypothetical protein
MQAAASFTFHDATFVDEFATFVETLGRCTLTNGRTAAQAREMTRTLLLLTLAATAALAGCNKEDHTIVAGPEGVDDGNATENAAPVQLPPSIASSEIYRCKDNSVVYIDWLSDNKSANFRADKDATPIQLTAAEPGKPMVAEGYSLSGTPGAKTVTLERPGKGSQACKA